MRPLPILYLIGCSFFFISGVLCLHVAPPINAIVTIQWCNFIFFHFRAGVAAATYKFIFAEPAAAKEEVEAAKAEEVGDA